MESDFSTFFYYNIKLYKKVCLTCPIRNRDMENYQTSMSQLTSGSHPYLKEKQAVCPSGLAIRISDGEAYVSK